jgi:NAD(P)-dependent dehydrogenase (short-subunit alcohol dehydrogenase family)
MDLQLGGKTALITGASKGIGRAAAERLALEGCDVILVSRTAADLATAKAAIASQSKVTIDTVAVDLSQSSSVDRLARDFPAIDILVNNAGAIPGGQLLDIDERTWRTAWDLKVFGYINMCRSMSPATRRRATTRNIFAVSPATRRSRHSANHWAASASATASG